MKALLDQNLSFRLVDVLLPRFPGTRQLADLLRTRADEIEKFVAASTEAVFMLRG